MRKLFGFTLVFVLLATLILPAGTPVLAADADYTITNDALNFDVNGSGSYATLALALAQCDGVSPVIQFGSGAGNTLAVPAGDSYCDLPSATYTGSIQFTGVTNPNRCGLNIPDGASVAFENLTLNNVAPTDTDDEFSPVQVEANGALTVSDGALIAAAYSTQKVRSLPVIENYGRLTVEGGTIGSDNGATKTISNSGTGTVSVSGGTIKTSLFEGNVPSGISCYGSGGVTVSGGTVSSTFYGIYDFGTSHVTINGGTVESTGTGGGMAILTYGGNITVSSGTVHSESGIGIAYSGYGGMAGAVINVSGGTVSSGGIYSAAIDLGKDGTTNISGSAHIVGAGTGIHVEAPGGQTVDNDITISGGGVESTSTHDISAPYAGSAVDMAASSVSSVSITGGTVKSANGNTLRLRKASTADAACFNLYGTSVYSHDEADIRITGAADDGKYAITGGNYGSATVTASDFASGREFAAWTSDSERETSISTTNGDTLETLKADSNTTVYLETAAASAPSYTLDVGHPEYTLPTGATYDGTSHLFAIGTGANNSTITVTGETNKNTDTANTITIAGDVTGLTLILYDVSIDMTGSYNAAAPIGIQSGAEVTIRLYYETTNTLISDSYSSFAAGLSVPDGADVTIEGDTGVLNATGNWGAGIGGDMGADAGTITINGGVINATGNGNSAGIGGGGTPYDYGMSHYDAGGDGGVITISGGTVTADASGMCYSAGIGGGAGGDGGTINVTGGTIVAKGSNSGGAGIGGGEGFDNFDDGAGGDITINDAASVTAVSSGNKPAIDASSGSGSVINARLNSALSESDTYLQCGSGRSLTLPGSYRNFAFSATAASTVKVYVNPSHATLLGSMIQTADNSPNIAEGLPSVTTAVKLYAPTVTIKKDGAAWAAGTPTLKLSTSQGALTGAISGTRVSNAYTFTGLNAATAYYVWDTTGNYYTGKSVTRTGADVTLDYYTVTLASGTGINSTTGGGTYLKGSNITFYAEVASGYNWSGWTQTTGGALVSTSNSDTIVAISSPISYTANAIATYALTVSLDGGNGATVSGAYASGAAVSIDAGTRSGYTFNGWTSSSGGAFTNASSASTTFTMPGNATTIAANWTQNGGGGSSTPPANNNTIVIVDNKDYSIGTENKNGSSTTATVDQAKLTDEIAKASEGSSAIFPVSANTTVTAQLVVKNVEDMAQKDMTLTVRTGGVAYNLNTSAIDTAAITAALGTTDSGNIPFNVTIAGSNVAVNGATLVVSPVEFTITCTYNGKTVAVDTFSSFVSRTVEITAEQATKITTAVVVEMDGSLRHVPTKVTVIGGKYYAVINSLTNSTYSVVWHPIEFSDVTNSWAKDAINNMGSRMVVNGVGGGNYEPDRDITRAEFAAIVVRALGLDTGMGSSSFTDVASGAWYYGYIQTAVGYGIVSGYGDGTFGPNDTITREQAMTMLARAMKITGLAPTLTDAQATLLLSKYTDASDISDYAKASVAACVDTGVVLGRTNAKLAAKDAITRAEVAAIVERLLRKSNLI